VQSLSARVRARAHTCKTFREHAVVNDHHTTRITPHALREVVLTYDDGLIRVTVLSLWTHTCSRAAVSSISGRHAMLQCDGSLHAVCWCVRVCVGVWLCDRMRTFPSVDCPCLSVRVGPLWLCRLRACPRCGQHFLTGHRMLTTQRFIG
jgi:hypothetical protein